MVCTKRNTSTNMKSLLKIKLLTLILFPAIATAAPLNKIDPGAIKISDDYAIEAAVVGLTLPTTAIFDGNDLIIAESGFLDTAKPRILRITPQGSTTVMASEGLMPPVTGLLMVDGTLYVSHRTKVSKVGPGGVLSDIVTDLPSLGDHQNNKIVLGPDGRIYMGQGTVTNSGVVGVDNYVFGWLEKTPEVHEIPCKDITLSGKNFETENPLTEANDKVMTGAYKPFGTASVAGEVIKGNSKCGGSIVSFKSDGSDFRLEAWGLRNPFGLKFDANGNLWATFHGADVRGSRSIYNDNDYFVKITKDAWYGWPEYFRGKAATSSEFAAPGSEKSTFLWQNHPKLSLPFAMFDPHSATNGFDFSNNEKFGFVGDAFVATFGTFTPVTTGPNLELSGFRILRLDMKTGQVSNFASNNLPGPAYLNRSGGFNRPSDVLFAKDGSMYVVDWGGSTITKKGLEQQPQTGVVWRIYNTNNQQLIYANGAIDIPTDPIPKDEHKPLAKNAPETYKMVGKTFWKVGAAIVAIILIIWLLKRV
jgi:glucose/arabinose dehydrogenase